jgi:hypothetical protein
MTLHSLTRFRLQIATAIASGSLLAGAEIGCGGSVTSDAAVGTGAGGTSGTFGAGGFAGGTAQTEAGVDAAGGFAGGAAQTEGGLVDAGSPDALDRCHGVEASPIVTECSVVCLTAAERMTYSGWDASTSDGDADGASPDACPPRLVPTNITCVYYDLQNPLRTEGDTCCYAKLAFPCGRPFTVSGRARMARARKRNDWGARPDGKPTELDPATARALAAAWLEDARAEHASIASFARFTMHLLALGAPVEIVEAAQRASLDEIEHAKACFALASRFAGEALGPARLDVAGSMTQVSLADVAEVVVLEGCVGETIAALQATAQLAVATDIDVTTSLRRIARDEAAHAQLAWTFVRWVCDVGLAWHAHGRLTPAEASNVRHLALRDVIAPSVGGLLGADLAPISAAL